MISRRCKIPGYPNDTYAIQSVFHKHLVNITIPVKKAAYGGFMYDKCSYIITNTSNATNVSMGTAACNEWVYDTSVHDSTFASKVHEQILYIAISICMEIKQPSK